VKVTDAILEVVVHSCISQNLDGHRPEIVTINAAKTLAAFEGRLEVTPDDIMRVAGMAIGFRTRRGGFEEPATAEEIRDVLQSGMKEKGLTIPEQVVGKS